MRSLYLNEKKKKTKKAELNTTPIYNRDEFKVKLVHNSGYFLNIFFFFILEKFNNFLLSADY